MNILYHTTDHQLLYEHTMPCNTQSVTLQAYHFIHVVLKTSPTGHRAWRVPETGSFFVQRLCNELDDLSVVNRSLLHALTNVVRRVTTDYESFTPATPESHRKKQTPVIETMLVNDVFFF